MCDSCAAELEEGDRFCSSCGQPIKDAAAPAWRPAAPKKKALCAACDHFRKYTALSSQIPYWNGTAISQALLKIREEEHKQRSLEAEHKVSLMKLPQAQWDQPPIMNDFCTAGPDGKTWIS